MEYWDIYDRNRNHLNYTHKRGDELKDGEYHLCIRIWIVNSKNQLLVQQRQPWKTYPNKWDCSVAGSALTGETSEDAVVREVKEELGIDIDRNQLKLIISKELDHCFDDNWFLRMDIPLNRIQLQEEEVADVKWLSFPEVYDLIESNQFISMKHLKSTLDILCKENNIVK